MDLILAVDLKAGLVVHGVSGKRKSYRPLTWGLSPSAEPGEYVEALSPRYLYIADLDRITGAGDHTAQIMACSALVDACYVDRGCRNPSEYLNIPGIIDIAATETTYSTLQKYPGGYLSIDMKAERVLPTGEHPRDLLKKAREWDFSGAIILNIGAVGTGKGLNASLLAGMKELFEKPLLYGGGVATPGDLDMLAKLGFDGAIIATAIHRGNIPLADLRRGRWS